MCRQCRLPGDELAEEEGEEGGRDMSREHHQADQLTATSGRLSAPLSDG